MNAVISHRQLAELTSGRNGRHDVACPICGPISGRSPGRAKRKVLRIWSEPGFASYYCVRCGARGHRREQGAASPGAELIARVRSDIAARDRAESAKQLAKAQALWARRRPLAGSIAERYLREARGYRGRLPETLGFLPPRGPFPPAMIAAFGFALEPEPGRLYLADDRVGGVHLTRLSADGSGKAGEKPKIMIGRSKGTPIVLMPPNDLLALAITEGIEDGLSVHESMGWGVWVAGCADRMPSLADAIPGCVEVTVVGDWNDSGRGGAYGLAAKLKARGIHVDVVFPGALRTAPA